MLDGLLKDQIRNDAEIAGMLTRYNGHPAFFYQKAPSDTDRKWENGCFPRVDYVIDMTYDPERKAAGVMAIQVWSTSECMLMPEDIRARLIELISGTFYTPAGQPTVCVIWQQSEQFEAPRHGAQGSSGETSPEVFGETILFDILSFPEQLTTDPDPVQGLNHFIKMLFPDMTIIAHDEIPPVWRPSDENPAIYWRFEGASANDKQTFAVNWYAGEFAAHVITDSVTERNRWTKAIVEQIQLYGEVILADSSPMFAKQIKIRHNADPLREGQLVLIGMYGVLTMPRKIPMTPPLNRVTYTHEHVRLEVRADGRKRKKPSQRDSGKQRQRHKADPQPSKRESH